MENVIDAASAWVTEKDWMTHGCRCVVLGLFELGHRCGYVGIPKDHPLHGLSYNDHAGVLSAGWEKVKEGPIGKRGIIPVLTADLEEAPSPELFFDVHGGLTYAGAGKEYPVQDGGDLWWFGFDCAHCGDKPDPNLLSNKAYVHLHTSGEVRDTAYVVAECESLAEQLAMFASPKLLTGKK